MYRHPEYGDVNLADIIENRLHWALQKGSRFFGESMLYDELMAARSWGISVSDWPQHAREDRIWMVAADLAERVKSAIESEDARREAERKRQRRKGKP